MSSDSIFGATMKDARGYLSPEDIRKVIAHASSLRDRLILWLLWSTGCRLSEMLLLEVKDISWSDKVLVMWTLKRKGDNRTQRPVLVDEATLALIQEYMRAYHIEEGPLIKIKKRRVRQIVLEVGTRAGISRVGNKLFHPHHFRHSHAVAWVRANPTMEGLRKLQQRLGHASLSTTAHYLQFAFAEQQAEVDAVLGALPTPT